MTLGPQTLGLMAFGPITFGQSFGQIIFGHITINQAQAWNWITLVVSTRDVDLTA